MAVSLPRQVADSPGRGTGGGSDMNPPKRLRTDEAETPPGGQEEEEEEEDDEKRAVDVVGDRLTLSRTQPTVMQ